MGDVDQTSTDQIDTNFLSAFNSDRGLVFKSGHEFKAEEHFGCRGRDTGNKTTGTTNQTLYSLCVKGTQGIQTYPKVSLHLNNKNTTTKQENTPVCDPHAPPVALPSGTYVQFDPHRALYSKQMFWALPFFNEEQFELVWSLVVQKFVWSIGNMVEVHSPSWQPVEETQIIPQVDKILKGAGCNGTNLAPCLRDSIKEMVQMQMMDQPAVSIIEQWLQCLTQMNYDFPVPQKPPPEMCMSNNIIFQPVDYSKVQMESTQGLVPILNIDEISKVYQETCAARLEKDVFKKVTLSHPWGQFSNILLLVVFNHPIYDGIPYIETLYRPFFPQILYCGPGLPKLNIPPAYPLKNFTFSFYPYPPTKARYNKGSFNYDCMVNAIHMHYPVDGILFTSDDLLFAPGKIKNFEHNATWFVPEWDTVTDDARDPIVWQWGFTSHRQQLQAVWHKIEKNRNTSQVLQQCYNNLLSKNGDRFRFNGALADIYYIPQRIAQEFAILGSVFLQHDVFLEMAVPTIIQCLDGLGDVEVLDGEYRTHDRNDPWKKFVEPKFQGRSYIHPTKWGHLGKTKAKHVGKIPGVYNLRQFFCTKALPWVHDAI